jgi:hypothetical protein
VNAGKFSIALVHYPVYDKNRQIVATAVTNLDIHDIARAARTFGADSYYIVTPVAMQQKLVNRVANHWQSGWGAGYNPKRKMALDLLRVMPDLAAVNEDMQSRHGRKPLVVVTGASGRDGAVSDRELAARIRENRESFLLLFGTGWGMTEEIFDSADLVLAPINGCGDYNHLSVRSAVSIYLDRIFGSR